MSGEFSVNELTCILGSDHDHSKENPVRYQ